MVETLVDFFEKLIYLFKEVVNGIDYIIVRHPDLLFITGVIVVIGLLLLWLKSR
jgi:hypothetical protein